MKQVLQSRKGGKAAVVEVPVPAVRRGGVLVRTVASVISAGTERAAVETVQKSLVQEASERPDLVRRVIDKARTEGLRNTFNAVRDKLSESQALGYSAAGIVMALGDGVTGFAPGDRVACAGLGFASHAEVLSVPKNLCVQLPDDVDFETGAFGTIGAIALQGVRLAEPTLGESVVVIGLGLVGQLTLQLLQANGCRVFCVDLDEARLELARQFGADACAVSNEDTKTAVMNWTRGRGADAVLITAATDSNAPIGLAGEVSRMKGRVVVVGMTGLAVPRQSYYLRELSLQISRSYGPGRYDPDYEERGIDYPFGYVRWTENRNIEAFLDLSAQRRIDLSPLISHRFAIADAERAYELITGDSHEPYLGVVLNYDREAPLGREVVLAQQTKRSTPGEKSVRLGVIGAGAYVPAMLLPHFKAAGAEFISIATASGVSALDVGKKFGFQRAVSEAQEIIDDDIINLVVIGTRHDLHAPLAVKAIERGKHVFVEKPLALNDEDLDQVLETASRSSGQLLVGFNRRLAPLAQKAKEFFADRRAPLSILYRVNAGRILRDHWVHDPIQGGGRIVGEVCHFIDLMQFWTGAPPVSVFAEAVSANRPDVMDHDSVFITLKFADGSNGCIAYLAEGGKKLGKERVEIFCEQKTFLLDDFRSANTYWNGREEKIALRASDKGQVAEVKSVCAVVLEGQPAPISLAELEATTRATFRINDSLRTGQPRKL
jgi:polar amino acid transport system substrate-binding protein